MYSDCTDQILHKAPSAQATQPLLTAAFLLCHGIMRDSEFEQTQGCQSNVLGDWWSTWSKLDILLALLLSRTNLLTSSKTEYQTWKSKGPCCNRNKTLNKLAVPHGAVHAELQRESGEISALVSVWYCWGVAEQCTWCSSIGVRHHLIRLCSSWTHTSVCCMY